ncbi:MAG: hypothetical protein AAF558_03120 [Verrucomicrobiota bacterium]
MRWITWLGFSLVLYLAAVAHCQSEHIEIPLESLELLIRSEDGETTWKRLPVPHKLHQVTSIESGALVKLRAELAAPEFLGYQRWGLSFLQRLPNTWIR